MPESSHNIQSNRVATSADPRWLLKYEERIYGPYSFEAIQKYIAEGRVAPHSIVAPEGTLAGSDDWCEASLVPEFAPFFSGTPSVAGVARTTQQVTAPARPEYGPEKGQIDRRHRPESSNFIIVIDVKVRYASSLERAIMSLGPAYKLAPNVWCVNADSTAAGLLNSLSEHIGKADTMFIVDATRDRSVWLNFGPETEAKIRRVWRRAL